jgi:hypothetical protein
VRQRVPFSIRKIQTDHGAECPLEFVLALQEAGIRPRYIRPPASPAERQGRAPPPDRSGGVLEPSPV